MTFVPLIALAILFGFFPTPVLDVSASSITALLDTYSHGLTLKAAALIAH